ncbi:MAG: hypothetical protein QNJ54_27285 [Prochloraceae cyanobacterium]|nr:hypothetical protein [Prochloraceae cyanobacterium]
MLSDVGVPPTIAAIFSNYRDIFCRQEGFDHVSRYITGLLRRSKQNIRSHPLERKSGQKAKK